MARRPEAQGGRTGNISVGGNVDTSALSTGHKTTQTVTNTVPAPSELLEALLGIRATLEKLSGPEGGHARIHADTAIKAAGTQNPAKGAVGDALQNVLTAAKRSADFAVTAAKLAPYLRTAVGWLGGEWAFLISLLV